MALGQEEVWKVMHIEQHILQLGLHVLRFLSFTYKYIPTLYTYIQIYILICRYIHKYSQCYYIIVINYSIQESCKVEK